MRVLLLAALLAGSLLRADDDVDQNVNSKYTIESVELIPSSAAKRVGNSIKSDMDALVGHKFDQEAIDKLSKRIGSELHRKVEHRIEKGTQPEHVKVVYDAPRSIEANADVTKLAYTSKEGFTGALQSNFDLAGLRVHAGMQSDADHLLERYAGYNLGASRRIGERVLVRLDFESFHQQWNATTIRALAERPDVPGVYRERYHVAPSVSVVIAEPLTVTFGVDIQHFETQFPAARFEASNAVTTTLRYRRRWSSDASRQEVDAAYGLRAATRTLGSDYVYARHAITAEYRGQIGESTFSARFLAGAMNGQAPLFERFTLGDSRTLRGWSKFDVAPLGGTRVAHGSLDYTFHWVGVFYDTGSVWDGIGNSNVKHSAGIALGGREGLYVAVAFPLRSGSVQPLFILGMNF
jgi:hypothetical protein